MLFDLRYALRALIRAPGFSAVAIVILAVGIGVNSAVFSIADAVLLRPLPYPHPDRLVELYMPIPGDGSRGPVSAIDFEDWREQSRAFEHLALINTLSRGLTLTGQGDPEQLDTAYVHPDFFTVLAIQPAIGRALRLDENEPGRNRVVVISHRLWLHRFSADPLIAGKNVTLDGQPFTVAGVTPPWFRFPEATIDVWAPESLIDAARAPRRRDTRYQRVVARLGPNVTLEQAGLEMKAIAGRLATQYPDTNAGRTTVTLVPLREALVGGGLRSALVLLLGAAGLVLLIGCVNVSTLLLARTTARRREIAIRLALGAGPIRVMRLLAAESLILAIGGGCLGLLAAMWSVDVLITLCRDLLPGPIEVSVHPRMFVFSLLASLLSAAIFGCAPAVGASHVEPNAGLKDGLWSTPDRSRRRLRSALVVIETALAVVLVVSAALMIKSFERLCSVDPGFTPGSVLTVSMNASSARYAGREQYLPFYREILASVQHIPGVVIAGSTRNLPLQGAPESWPLVIEGAPPIAEGSEPILPVHQISPGYFRAMGIPLLSGRAFTDQDDERSARVAIISRAMAQRFWPNQDPVGRSIRYGPQVATVVGVAGDVRQSRIDMTGTSEIYVPQLQEPRRGFTLVIRAAGDPRLLQAMVRARIQAIDPEHPIIRMAPMTDVMDAALARPRLMTVVLGAFGGMALGLALMGLYGVIAYSVARRTHEIGVRMTLGARPRDVMWMVLRDGALLTLAGVSAGALLALAVTRLLVSQLYEVSPTDASVLAGVAALVFVTGLIAACVPSLRAARVDPLVSLRCE